jgi:hypothetical protein
MPGNTYKDWIVGRKVQALGASRGEAAKGSLGGDDGRASTP